ncbi:glycosyltransferase family 10 domain-containing protein [Olivibacter sitiensis]|uniref:glycosyltransferase family 10 domain-containing protein n=1 Tax=Olivibacter sitiensis TaxID=376470 RepID=UPI00041974C1|nr:glycosyltransferase family 10 [Olivibacter sitiensis]
MQKKKVKIKFAGFWSWFDYKTFLPYQLLSKHYDVIVTDDADYMFCTLFDNYEFSTFKGVRIFWTGECFVPDFNLVDYAFTLDNIVFNDRALQIPYFVYGQEISGLIDRKLRTIEDVRKKTGFCNFIYSHEGIPQRTALFNTISTYKKVDSAGRYLNNMDGFTPGARGAVSGLSNSPKIDFQRNYKFTISCENYVFPDYVTEKIAHAFLADTVPIYFGDKTVAKYFNPKAFINCADFSSWDDCLQYVIEVDNNDNLYLNMLNEPVFYIPDFLDNCEKKIEAFLLHIFEQEYNEAFRRPDTIWPNKHAQKLLTIKQPRDYKQLVKDTAIGAYLHKIYKKFTR